MKHLRLDTVYNLLVSAENILSSRAIKNYLEGFTMNLLLSDTIDEADGFPITENHFFDSGDDCFQNKQHQIELIGDDSLTIDFDAFCEFEYHTVDETDIGLGAKGEICGIENSWFDITGITLYLHDGSEFDLTNSEAIREHLTKFINIE